MSAIACGESHIQIIRSIRIFKTDLYCVDECFQQIFLVFPIFSLILTYLVYSFAYSYWLTRFNFRNLYLGKKVQQILIVLVIICEISFFLLKIRMGYVYLIVQALKILTHTFLMLCIFNLTFVNDSLFTHYFIRILLIPDILLQYSQVFTLIYYSRSEYSLDLVSCVFEALFSTIFWLFIFRNCKHVNRYHPLDCDEDSSLFNKIFFFWVNPLLDRASNYCLENSNYLFTLPESLSSTNSLKVAKSYVECPEHFLKNFLIKFLFKKFSLELLCLGLIRIFADAMSFMFPIFLNKILSYLDGHQQKSFDGFYFAFALFIGTFLNSVMISYFNFRMNKLALKARTILINMIYEKIFLVRSSNLSNSIGQLLNLTNTDIERIVNFSPSLFQFISLPIQLLVTLYLLYSQVGIVFLSAVVFILALIPVNRWICNKIGDFSQKMMKAKDERLTMMTEVLRSIRTIRMCNWIETFSTKIQIIRDKEVKYLKFRKQLDALCVYFWATTPVIVSSLVFGTYSYINGANSLNSSMIFTSLALLGMLIQPLNALPWVLNGLIEALVSVRRLEKFLFLQEINFYTPGNITNCDPTYKRSILYKFQDCDFGYEDKSNYMVQSKIKHISLEIKSGDFIGLVGRVASGKSTFLKSLLNELHLNRGKLFFLHENIQKGIAYVSQDPWLQDTTVKDNILFGKEYDEKLYSNVLELCNLRKDLSILPQGDMTMIGNHGSTLSGGQRLRISLARAFYQELDIFIFDEPFAGLDEQVADNIFYLCTKYLYSSKKTIILSTNHLQYLRDTDYILCFSNETIDRIVSFNELLSVNQSGAYIEMNISNQTNKNQMNEDENAFKEDEQRQVGVVEWNVYKYYFAAIGYFLFFIIILFVLLMQFSKTSSDFWLSYSTSNKSSDSLPFLEVFISIAVANSFFTLIRAFSFAWGGVRAAIVVHTRLLSCILNAAMSFFDITDFGIIINRFSSDTFNVDDALPFTLNIFLAQMGSLLGSLVVIIYGMPWMAFFVFILFFPYFIIQESFRNCSRELKRLCAISLSPIYSWLEDTVQGLMTIRAFRQEKRFSNEINKKISDYNRIQYANGAVQQWLNLWLQLLGVIITASVALIAVTLHYYNNDYSNSGLIGLALVYCLSLTGILNGSVQSFTQTELDLISLERIMKIIQIIQLKYPERYSFDEIDNFYYVDEDWIKKGQIQFRFVSARYRPNLPSAVKLLNFTINEGQKVAIIGRTGSGKSTIFQILFGLLPCENGDVLIDGIDINRVVPEKLRSGLCLLSQHPFLFSGTIRENMDPADKYTDEEIHQALFKCKINILCDSLGGIYSEFKENLSIGQKQLFCLARALLHHRKIICLDEMTTNIDDETKNDLNTVLQESFADCTILHIAHDLNAVSHYDRFIWMDSGRIVKITKSLLFDGE